MRKQLRTIFLLFTVGILSISCEEATEEEIPDISHINVNLNIQRADQQIKNFKTKEDVISFLKANPMLAEVYFERRLFPNDSILVNRILDFATNVHTDTLFMDIDKAFDDFSEATAQFTEAFTYFKYYYPDQPLPVIYTVATALGQAGIGHRNFPELFVSKDMIVISLDYFCGKGATYKPQDSAVPEYMLNRLSPEYLVPTAMKLYGSFSFVKSDLKDQTLLAEMIYYGKGIYFADKMMPYTADSLIMSYSGMDLARATHNQKDIYTYFIKNNLFYEKVPFTKDKYVGERPKVPEIADQCPGRIGRWMGWQICKSYMLSNSEISFPQFMENINAQKIFQDARYKPKKPAS